MPGLRDLVPLPIRRALGGWWHRTCQDRRKRKLLHALRGEAVTCNVCGWTGARFTEDHWHPGTICPSCGSQVRHRLLAAAFDGLALSPGMDESTLLKGRRILHFAPERQLRDRVRRAAAKHVTADFDRGDCDLRLDISAMPSVGDESFDVVIACDVLEHVPDDRAAFRELFRVLAPGGITILTVPQRDSPASTDEDPAVTAEADRIVRFGQKDHVRMYGDDFVNRATEAGFSVDVLTADSFPHEVIMRHILIPPAKSSHPLATNERRIYFARKISH